ncbi:hypothetical protein [Salinicoccus sp. HZC-1]|uniref:hypothetical protein n=1 Tax=Salinicoccus sp. HZC-1 TaxID=3385497 RepID=UPI00398B0005
MTEIISVGVFQGSSGDSVFSDINELVIKVMEAGNMKVTNVEDRTDCGYMNDSTAGFDQALERAMENIEAYERHGFDYIVNTIVGGGMALKEYDKLFVPGTAWYDRAKTFTNKVRDISVIMDMADLEFKHEVERTAVYQSPYELENIQKIFDEPVKIIKQIPGLNFIEKQRDEVQEVKPDLIITSNFGWRSHTKPGIDLSGTNDQVEVKHLVEVVAESCGIASNQ